MSSNNDPDFPFESDAQNAIFNFVFALVGEYGKTMPLENAVDKTCDWLISLATDIKHSYSENKKSEEEKLRSAKDL